MARAGTRTPCSSSRWPRRPRPPPAPTTAPGSGSATRPPSVAVPSTTPPPTAELVAAAELAPPYLLVGPSGGGLLAINYAARYPDQVAGIVLLDTPAPLEDLSKEFPGSSAWKNPEHLDYVHGERTLAMNPPKLGDLPISIVTATDGASSEEDQAFWLDVSTGARQTTLTGEHDLTSDNQDGVIAEIRAALDRVRG